MKSRVRSLVLCLTLLLSVAAVGRAKQIYKESKNSATVQQSAKSLTSAVPSTQTSQSTSGLTNTATGEQINWQVISGGGVNASSANYAMTGTIGQTAAGPSSSSSYSLNAGFWQNFAASGGCCIGDRGNVNGDPSDAVDISDVIYLVDYSFGGGPAPPCAEEADVNGDSSVDISDMVYLVDYSFGGGAPPVACP